MVRFKTALLLSLALMAFGPACGGDEVGKSQASGAAAGVAGASAGASGAAQGGRGGSAGGAVTAGQSGGGGVAPNPADCPPVEPEPASECVSEGLACRYAGICCDVIARCIVNGGVWGVTPTCAPTCPAEPPAQGSACDFCRDLGSCAYDRCGDGSGDVLTATCNREAGTWSVNGAPCGPVSCGNGTCPSNQICVTAFNTCVDNPCLNEPLSCTCAQLVCGTPGSGYQCVGVEPRKVNCICQTC